MVRFKVFECVDGAGGPANFNRVCLGGAIKAKMDAQVVLRIVTATATYFFNLDEGLAICDRPHADTCAHPGFIRLRSDRTNFYPVAWRACIGSGVAAKQLRQTVYAVYDDVDITIIIKIPKGATARSRGIVDARTAPRGNFFKLPIAQVAIKILVLSIGRIDMSPVDLRVDMAV